MTPPHAAATLPGLFHWAGVLLVLGAAAAVLWDLLARAGTAPATWLRHHPAGALDRWGVRFLLGLLALGTALLGLALTGLFTRPLVLLALPVLAAGAGVSLRSPLAAAVAALRALPRSGIAAAAVGGLPLLPWLLSPRVDQDALKYHLGFPWGCLATGRAPLDDVSATFHLPLPLDIAHAIPLALGEDRLARWLLLGACAAACAVVAGRALARGDRRSGWLGPLLALSTPGLFWLATTAKNDLGASACLVAGAVLWLEEGSPTAAALLGASVAAKLTNAPLAVLWFLAAAPRRRTRRPAAAVIGALPVLPWLVKGWLATGNPVYPALWRLFPSPFWGRANEDAIRATGVWLADTYRPDRLVHAWLGAWWRDYPVPGLGLLLLAATGRAGVAAVLMAGSLLTLSAGHMSRFFAPAAWLAAALLPAALDRIAGRAARSLAALAAFLAVVAIWRSPAARAAPWGDALLPADSVRAADLTTFDSAVRALAPSAPHRILSIAEERTYRLPGRVLYNGFPGETPIVWRLVRASRTVDELARRFHQLGADIVWYNFISAERASFYSASFGWNDRMLRLYHGFCGRYLEVRSTPGHVDARGGGIYVFAIRERPLSRPPAAVWFLPGAEAPIREARVLRDTGREKDAILAFGRILAVVPGTLYFADQLGLVYYAQGDWPRAAAAFRPSVDAGMIDGVNLPSYGAAITYLGRYDEAIRVLNRCLEIYDTVAPNRVNLAWAHRERAVRSMAAGRLSDAARDLDAAANALALVPKDPAAFYAEPRRQVAALVDGSREELERRAGHPAR